MPSQELYSWDKGNQLNYPIVYIDIGYYKASEESHGIFSIPDYEYDYEIQRNDRSSDKRKLRGQSDPDAVIGNDVYVSGDWLSLVRFSFMGEI